MRLPVRVRRVGEDEVVATAAIPLIGKSARDVAREHDGSGEVELLEVRLDHAGRGAEQSYCLLVSRAREELTETAAERLEALVESSDGFELAERDLEIRGEGQLLGARQSGYSDLRFVRLRRDRGLLEHARDAARDLPSEGLLADAVDRLVGEAEHLGES